MSNRSVPIKAQIVLAQVKEAPGASLGLQFVISKPWKKLWNWIYYYWNSYCTSCGYSVEFSQRQCKIQLTRDNLGEQKVLEISFFRLSECLKSKISLWQTAWCQVSGFNTELLFWASWRFECMVLHNVMHWNISFQGWHFPAFYGLHLNFFCYQPQWWPLVNTSLISQFQEKVSSLNFLATPCV